jgi:hypothetical protein
MTSIDLRYSGHRLSTKQAIGDRRNIAVEDDEIRREKLFVREDNTANFAMPDLDVAHAALVTESRALVFGDASQRAGKFRHPPLNAPHSILFGMCDQHQRCRRLKGR